MESTGVSEKLHQFLHVLFGFVDAGNIGKGRGYLILTQQLSFALAKTHRATTAAAATLHLAHKEHKHGDDDENGEAGDQQLGPNALLFGLTTLNFDVVAEKIIHQFGIFNHRPDRFEGGSIITLCRNGQSIHDHFPDSVVIHFLNKVGVADLLGGTLHVEVVEYRQKHCGND